MQMKTNQLLDPDYLASRAKTHRHESTRRPRRRLSARGGTVYLTAADASA